MVPPTTMETESHLAARLETLPSSPGVYIFRGEEGAVLYVGKARNLRSRVRSYFQPGTSDVRAFVARLGGELRDIETVVVRNEKEAALLENQIIKEQRPRYNVKLRDDKDYLSLRLDPKGSWPRLEVVRRPRPDGALYFGPYDSATAARQTLRAVNRHFQLRTCSDSELKSRKRPCLQYQIKRCPAPCVFDVPREEYGEQVRNVALFLEGRHDELIRTLSARMERASSEMQYERAAMHRDQLRAVERVREEQQVTIVKDVDQDVLGLFRQADQAEVAILRIRSGKLVGVQSFGLDDIALPDAELIASFVRELYLGARQIPDEILLPVPIEAMDGLSEVLTEQRAERGSRARRCRVTAPRRGARKKLLDMARDNAQHAYREKRRAEDDVEERLARVQERLGLPTPPRRIECLDISHHGGADTVGVVVALQGGAPDRRRYRSFHVRGVEPSDDYGAMYQVLSRRFRRGRTREAGWELPDLFVVDGGKGQLNVARTAAADLGVTGLPMVALAKEKERPGREALVDRIYVPGRKNPIAVHSSPALAMLALARDEAHRASNELRRKRGKRRLLGSALDAVPGVGPKTRNKLLGILGSLKAVREASEDELVKAGASRPQAAAIVAHLGPLPPPAPPAVEREAEDTAIENAFHETHDD